MTMSDACSQKGAHPHGVCHQRGCQCPCHLVMANIALQHYRFPEPKVGDVQTYRRWLRMGQFLVQSDYVSEWEN